MCFAVPKTRSPSAMMQNELLATEKLGKYPKRLETNVTYPGKRKK